MPPGALQSGLWRERWNARPGRDPRAVRSYGAVLADGRLCLSACAGRPDHPPIPSIPLMSCPPPVANGRMIPISSCWAEMMSSARSFID